jgi:hypothetical protein
VPFLFLKPFSGTNNAPNASDGIFVSYLASLDLIRKLLDSRKKEDK